MKKIILLFCTAVIATALTAQPAIQFDSNLNGFMPNYGQIVDQNHQPNGNVKYLLSSHGLNVALTANGFSYDTWTEKDEAELSELLFHRVDVQFVNSNSDCEVVTENMSEGVENFYTVDGEEITGVHRVGKVTYKNIYYNIDVEFVASSGSGKPFEYNFILHNGADPSQVQLNYVGANSYSFSEEKLTLHVAHGEVYETIPRSYYADNGSDITIKYKLISQHKNSVVVGFATPFQIVSRELVVDPNPSLSWGTYYGSGGSYLRWLHLDSEDGSVYLQGLCNSASNIATAGSYQSTLGGMADLVVARFDTTGNRIWCTYFGGSGSEEHGAITVMNGRVVILGHTNSTSGIATVGAHSTSYMGMYDALVAVFDTSGSRLWATYYGGTGQDYPYGLDVDANDNIYISGHTTSTSGISTPGSFQPNYNNNIDGFVVKFTPTGTRVWGTYFGGFQQEVVLGLAVQGSRVAVVGQTSSGGISTAGVHQPTSGGGLNDGMLITFDTSGARVWGTYFGGNNSDQISDVCWDVQGNINVSGSTASTSGIAFGFSVQPSIGGGNDGFLAHFSSTGQCIWSTYIGGTSTDQGYCVHSDSAGNIIAGVRAQSTGLGDPAAFQPNHAGGFDDVLLRGYRINGALEWSTYYGGPGDDVPWEINISSAGAVFVCGETNSAIGIATPGSFQPVLTASQDGFFSRFNYCFIPNSPVTMGTTICSGSNAILTSIGVGIVGWYANPSGGAPLATGNSFTTPVLTATTTYYVQDSAFCGASPRSAVIVNVQPGIIATVSLLTNDTLCAGDVFTLQCNNSSSTYQWWESNNVLPGETNQNLLTSTAGNYRVFVTTGVCSDTSDSVITVVNALPVVSVMYSGPSTFCVQDSATIHATQGFSSYLWSNGSITDSTIVTSSNYYVVTVTDSNGCQNMDSIQLNAVNCLLVWPGNANNDTIVDNNDMLPIGIHYGATGTARNIQGITWQGNPALDWGTPQINGNDVKHADCDGNGIVNAADTLAVNQNYGLIDLIPLAPVSSEFLNVGVPVYFVTANTTYLAGDTIEVEVWIGDTSIAASTLYGIALKATNSSPVATPFEATFPNNLLCNPAVDGLTLDVIFPQRCDLAMTRFDHTTRAGYGHIASIWYATDSSITLPQVETFTVADLNVVDSLGNNLQSSTLNHSVTILPVITGISENVQLDAITIFPNPSSGESTIVCSLINSAAGELTIFDLFGNIVFTAQVTNGQLIKFTGESAGFYTVRITATDQSSSAVLIQY
jgi:hypothetical protein